MNKLDEGLETRMNNSPYRCDPEDKVLILMDVRNVTCRQSMEYANTRIHYGKMLSDILNGRKLVAAIAVDGVQYDDKGRDVSRLFHEELRRANFRVDLVKASNNKGKQEGVDVMIAILAMRYVLHGWCDTVELITGDGDFTVLVKEIQSSGVTVCVRSLLGNLSYALGDQADCVSLIDDHPIVMMEAKKTEAI